MIIYSTEQELKCAAYAIANAAQDMNDRKITPLEFEQKALECLEKANLESHKKDSRSFVSQCCIGEKCSVCGEDATAKLSEVIFDDDPIKQRHELTAYVCNEHFRLIVG